MPVKPLTVLTDQSARVVLPSHTMCGGDRLELSETSTETWGAVCVAGGASLGLGVKQVEAEPKTLRQ